MSASATVGDATHQVACRARTPGGALQERDQYARLEPTVGLVGGAIEAESP